MLGEDIGCMERDVLPNAKNIIHSSTEINDDTYRSKNFTPLNFDKTFSGKVKVYEALQRSLNIPTVKVLEKIGVNNFLGILNKNKVNYVLPKKHNNPGLAIALGGIGISLEELGALYVAVSYTHLTLPTTR